MCIQISFHSINKSKKCIEDSTFPFIKLSSKGSDNNRNRLVVQIFLKHHIPVSFQNLHSFLKLGFVLILLQVFLLCHIVVHYLAIDTCDFSLATPTKEPPYVSLWIAPLILVNRIPIFIFIRYADHSTVCI